MPSAINDTIPANGAPLQSAPVRANFAAAKSEIEALQSSVAGVITASSTTTLTNKTISGVNNTLTNIAQSSVTNLTGDLALKSNLANPHIPVATSRVAQLSDMNNVIDNATASPVNITIPLSSTLNFPDGIILSRYYSGTGLGTFIPAGGVTIQGTAPTPTQFGYVSVQHITDDIWTWVGGSGGGSSNVVQNITFANGTNPLNVSLGNIAIYADLTADLITPSISNPSATQILYILGKQDVTGGRNWTIDGLDLGAGLSGQEITLQMVYDGAEYRLLNNPIWS